MTELSAQEVSCLTWMTIANGHGVGLFGPSVGRTGQEPTCERLIDKGLAYRKEPPETRDEYGYWITINGRRTLYACKSASPSQTTSDPQADALAAPKKEMGT